MAGANNIKLKLRGNHRSLPSHLTFHVLTSVHHKINLLKTKQKPQKTPNKHQKNPQTHKPQINQKTPQPNPRKQTQRKQKAI